jgi:cytoskeleton protein RodZ
MAQIGSILREARIRMGLNLKQVAEITKVRVKYLQALEEDDYGAIPGPTFIKAYLRTYASVLRLDSDALVEEYRTTYERRKSSQSEYYDLTLEQMRSRTMKGRKKRPVRNTRRGYTLAGVLAILAVVLLAYFGSRSGQGEAVLGVDSFGRSTTTLSGAAGSTTTLGGATTTTSSLASFTGEDVRLRIVASGDCFVVIKEMDASGTILEQLNLKSGEEITVEGSKRYWVNLGNPDVVKVFINGAQHQVSGTGGGFYVTETKIERAP